MGVISNSPNIQLKDSERSTRGGVKTSKHKWEVGTPVFAIGGSGPIYGRSLANRQVLVLRYTLKEGMENTLKLYLLCFLGGEGKLQTHTDKCWVSLAGRLTAMCPDSGRWGQFRQIIPPSVRAIAGLFSLGTLKLTPPKSSLAPSYGLALAGMP